MALKFENKSKTILIIDDSPINLAVGINHLEEYGFRVVIAQTGLEGIKRAQFVKPDLILLDVVMPEMNGFETCKRLKTIDSLSDIPVIFMSALETIEDKIIGFESGGIDYITKPFQINEVLARINIHLTMHSMKKQLASQNVELQKEIGTRVQVEAVLQQIHDELEDRVAQRTHELAELNDRLKIEISERMEKEAKIRRLVDSNIIGIYFWDIDGNTIDANDAFLKIVGYSREELFSGRVHWSTMTPPEHQGKDENALDELKATGSCTPYEKEYIKKDGSKVPVFIGAALFENSSNKGVAFVVDLTERRQAEGQIRHMAHHDALTGLPNRTLFQDRVTQAVTHAQRSKTHVGMFFIDLDHFKDINDSLGHQIGDRLLRSAARRLQRCIRKGDSVARLGGDEFVISAPGLEHDDDAAFIATKALDALRRPFFIDQHELHVTGSIGISLYPTDGQDAEELMRAADTAMYYSKDRGRDNYQFFTARLNEAAQRRLTIANRLHQALQKNEFVLHYQPNVDIASGQILSAEALIRWYQPQMGLISPGEFVKIAEETGLIVQLGEWVLRTACEQLKYWRSNGHPYLRIAVNLSPNQFRRPGFADLAAEILRESRLPADALGMEITEGILMQSPENLVTLEQLAALGISLSVDDFGTGYSSLAYLQRFPIQALKIDQSFVAGIDIDAGDTTIVNAIIAMAHSLGLKVVAEGVETVEQLNFLTKHGCDAVQGFYFSKAVPATDFIQLLGKSYI